MSLLVYYSSVSGSSTMKTSQMKILNYLDSKKIPYETVDISQSTEFKDDMRKKCGLPNALPPQIFNGGTYCGDFTGFEEAVEMDNVEEFLKLK